MRVGYCKGKRGFSQSTGYAFPCASCRRTDGIIVHLQGGMLDGRALCADGRNETEWIEVRDLAAPWSPQHYQEWISAARSTTQPIPSIPLVEPYPTIPSQNMYHQPFPTRTATSTISTIYNNGIGIPQYRRTESIGIPYNSSLAPALAAMPLSPPMPLLELHSVPSSPGPLSFPLRLNPDSAAFAVQPPATYNMLSPPVMDTQFAPQPSYNSTMAIVKSKVIFTSIPPKASFKELDAFIRLTLRSSSLDNSPIEDPLQALESVQIEKHPDGTQKSHAFLVFETYEMAQAIVDLLDGVKFHGRALKVKLAKEGTASDARIGTGARLRPILENSYVGGYPHSLRQNETFTRSSRKLSRDGFKVMDNNNKSSAVHGNMSIQSGEIKISKMTSSTASSEIPHDSSTPCKRVENRTTPNSSVLSSSSAAVAAAAKMRETSPDIPLVVDGSSPWHSS
ncbi:hypothetical protein ACMFMG_008188 [Clarireedia jacksonii]